MDWFTASFSDGRNLPEVDLLDAGQHWRGRIAIETYAAHCGLPW
jgi:hypothetical protein